jgi:ferritin-like metal-binding protein YciE
MRKFIILRFEQGYRDFELIAGMATINDTMCQIEMSPNREIILEPCASRAVALADNTSKGDFEMAQAKTLETLFHETLKDIYYAERKILKALPKMAKGANAPELKAAFEKHRDETEVHVERLQQVFEAIGKPARGKTCEAIEGIIAEGEEILEDFKGQPALDAGLASAAQAVEHYEIARYGTLARWAKELGYADARKLLVETLGEEEATDETLSALAEGSLNQSAMAA